MVALFGMIDILSLAGSEVVRQATLRIGYVQLNPAEDAIKDKCRNSPFHVGCSIVLNRSWSLTVQHLDLCGCRLFVGHRASVETAVSSLRLYYGQPAVEPLFRKA